MEKLYCEKCDASAEAACSCGVDYITAARRNKEKAIAMKQANPDLTQAEIATSLGVSQSAVRDYLAGLVPPTKPNRPKGGRPAGGVKKTKARHTTDAAKRAAKMVLDEGRTHEEAAKEAGLGSELMGRMAVAREEGRREAQANPIIDPATLSMSAQKKLAAAIRQATKRLEVEIEERIKAEVRKSWNDVYLPSYKKHLAEADRIIKSRRGFISHEDYRWIKAALNAGHRHTVSDGKLTELSMIWEKLERVLVAEKGLPTAAPPLPATWEEWEVARRQAAAERSAKAREAAANRKASKEASP